MPQGAAAGVRWVDDHAAERALELCGKGGRLMEVVEGEARLPHSERLVEIEHTRSRALRRTEREE